MLHTLDYLGEGVRTLAEADQATRNYLRVITSIIQAGIGRNLSLKLTQLGLDVDRATTVDNMAAARVALSAAVGPFRPCCSYRLRGEPRQGRYHPYFQGASGQCRRYRRSPPCNFESADGSLRSGGSPDAIEVA